MRNLLLYFAAAALTAGPPFAITPAIQDALNQISADSLRGNLSFIASDLLEGRDTPSRGLDIAAEYIAAQFRKTGLEPAGEDGFFQTAKLIILEPSIDGFQLTFTGGGKTSTIETKDARVQVNAALDLNAVPVFKFDPTDSPLVEKTTPEDLQGKVVLIEFSRRSMQNGRAAFGKLRRAHPALVLMLARKPDNGSTPPLTQLFDPTDQSRTQNPTVRISGETASHLYDSLKPGLTDTTAGAHISTPKEQPVLLHNVVAILRGSDPALKNTAVMVSAHYDHIGTKPSGDGDRIYNGANDDGSGTVSVIELAKALSTLKERPKRSIVFVTFFGEERGLYGSRYYSQHPVIPLANTVADINLEQVGRTDSSEGPQIANATLTGFDYSNLADYVKAAGNLTGIEVYNNERNSDQYFSQSDNISFAEAGVPAHSLSVAFVYPDYHGLGDEWQKIDYENMARVDRMVAVTLLMLANSPDSPHWNAENQKVQPFLKAWHDSRNR